VHVLRRTAHLRFIDFDSTEKLPSLLFHGRSQSVVHEPRRLLGDADMLCQLDAGYALAGGGKQVNGNKPFAERYLARSKNSACLDGEILLAFGTTIPLAPGECVNFLVAAVRAILTNSEPDAREIGVAGFFIVKVHQELGQRFKIQYVFHSGRKLPHLFRVIKCQNQIYFMKKQKRIRQKMHPALNYHTMRTEPMNTTTAANTLEGAADAYGKRLEEIRAEYGSLSAFLNDEKPVKRHHRSVRSSKKNGDKLAPC
jgi:hypothetical protein